MRDNRTSGRTRVRSGIGGGWLIALLMLTQAGCPRHGSPYATYTEAETKSLIEKLTGCTMPKQANDMRAFAFDAKGRYTYASFRIPPEASSEVLAAFQRDGVVARSDESYSIAFIDAALRQDEIGLHLFDPAVIHAPVDARLEITGPVRCLAFSQESPPEWWLMVIFEEKGVVWFASEVNVQD
jgi:hypothetical protein